MKVSLLAKEHNSYITLANMLLGFIGKSISIWSQLIATVSNKVLSFDEFQRSTKARTPCTKSRSDSVVNPISSEGKLMPAGSNTMNCSCIHCIVYELGFKSLADV